MSNLVAMLKSWNFQSEVQHRLEISGFKAHLVYQDEVYKFAIRREIDTSDLKYYWSEVAREWVACSGKVNVLGRSFHGEIGYRSSFLDALASRRLNDGWRDIFPLHPAESAFLAFLEEPSGYGLNVTQRAESEKLINCTTSISNLTRSSRYDDVKIYFCEKFEEIGFVRSDGGLILELDNELIFSASLDRWRSKIFQIGIDLKIWHKSNANIKFNIVDFGTLVPGFSYNSVVQSDFDVHYAVDAYASIIYALYQSICGL